MLGEVYGTLIQIHMSAGHQTAGRGLRGTALPASVHVGRLGRRQCCYQRQVGSPGSTGVIGSVGSYGDNVASQDVHRRIVSRLGLQTREPHGTMTEPAA